MGHACHLPVMILSFRTDRSGQTVQIQIRLLLDVMLTSSLIWVFTVCYSICIILTKFQKVTTVEWFGLFIKILGENNGFGKFSPAYYFFIFSKIFLLLKHITFNQLLPNHHLIPLYTPISWMYTYVPGHANYEHARIKSSDF